MSLGVNVSTKPIPCWTSLKEVFHKGDRASIYIFIASSYTPWLILKPLNIGALNYFMVWLVWAMAGAGITYQYTFHEKYKSLESFLYIVIGVCPSAAFFSMEEMACLSEIAASVLVFVVGGVFFKSDGRLPFAHAIWHCFVVAGAILQYTTVCKYLLGINCS